MTEKQYHNDLYLLEIDTMSWKLVEPKAGVAPTPREGHTATIYMDKLFIFGGFTDRGDTALNDMHVLDVKSMIWSRPNFSGDRPKPRQYATSIRHGGKILVTGGCDFAKKSCFNDMFELDLKSKSWSETEFMSDKSYPPREDFTLTVVRNRVFLVGGCFLTHRCFGGERSRVGYRSCVRMAMWWKQLYVMFEMLTQMSRNTKLALRARTQVRVTACVDTVYVCVFRVSWVLTVQKG